MYNIRLKKKSYTKTSNNSYDILLKKDKNSLPIGSYSQNKMIIILDIETYVFALTKGCSSSEKFKKIFIRATSNISNKKNLKINFKNDFK
jgi:hypothetical protein